MAEDSDLHGRVGRLEVDVATIKAELLPIKGWVEESRDFHRQMLSFRDVSLAAQEQTKKDLLSEQNKKEAEQTKRHRANSTKLNWLLVVVAVLTLLATVIGVVYTVEASKHAELDPAKIFHSFAHDLELSLTQPKAADLPSTYVPR